MPKSKGLAFKACAKAIRKNHGHGISSPTDIQNIKNGRIALLAIISELASGKPCPVHVREALEDLHPRTEYCQGMMIRDIADVCVTLNRFEQGRRRSDEQKSIDANMLCQYLAGELGG